MEKTTLSPPALKHFTAFKEFVMFPFLKFLLSKLGYYFLWIAILASFTSFQTVFAQSGDYFRYTKQGRDGYWQVKTDPATKCTEVTFYDKQGEVLYQEELKGKYLKLNRRNTEILNNSLYRLTTNRLVASEVKSAELFANKAPINELVMSSDWGRAVKANSSGNLSSQLHYNILTLSKTVTMVVILDNTASEPLKLRIKDEKGRSVFSENTSYARYRKEFHLRRLEEGKYTLVISAHKQKQKFIQPFEIVKSGEYKTILLTPQNK
jgi:hypothetical protein